MTPLEELLLAAYIAPHPAEVQPLIRQARSLILSVMPDTVEQLDPSIPMIAYGIDRTYRGLICSITIFKSYINIMLAQGASLADPQGILKGSGKKARHIRIAAPSDLEDPGVKEMLQAALVKKLGEVNQR